MPGERLPRSLRRRWFESRSHQTLIIDLVPGTPGSGTARLHARIRERLPALDEDRPPSGDIAAVKELVSDGAIATVVAEIA